MQVTIDEAHRIAGKGVLYWPGESPTDVRVTGHIFDSRSTADARPVVFLTYSSVLQPIKSEPFEANITLTDNGFSATQAGAPEATSTLTVTKSELID